MSNPWPPYIKRFFRNLTFSFTVLFLLFLLCLLGLLSVADMVFMDKDHSFDTRVFNLIHPYTDPGTTAFFKVITFFGSQDFLIPASIILVILFLIVKKTKWDALKVAAIVLSSRAALLSLKFILERERPLLPLIAQEHGYSFPSGHSFSGLVFFGMLVYITYKRIDNPLLKWSIIVFLIALVLLIGFSRIYLKVHYASDVIAGYCLGIIWLLLSKWFLFTTRRKVKSPWYQEEASKSV